MRTARDCLNRRAESVGDLPAPYSNLRIATRDRDKLVRLRMLMSNRIHGYVDRLFPGFLKIDKSGLDPFCKASLDLMEDRFSPQQLSRRPRQALAEWLGRCGVNDSDEGAGKLKKLAKETLRPASEQFVMLQRRLAQRVKLYRDLLTSIWRFGHHVGGWLDRRMGTASSVARGASALFVCRRCP